MTVIIFIIAHAAACVAVTAIVFIVPVLIALVTLATQQDAGGPLFVPALAVMCGMIGVALSAAFLFYSLVFQLANRLWKVKIYVPALLALPTTYLLIKMLGVSFPKNNDLIVGSLCGISFALYLLYWGISSATTFALTKSAERVFKAG